MKSRANVAHAILLLWCCPEFATGGYATMRAVVTLQRNPTVGAPREYNAVSSCLYPTWTLVEAALSNHSHRDGDECRCYDDRFSTASKTCMPCFEEVPGLCNVPEAVTSSVCSSASAPVKLKFVAGVAGTIEDFSAKKQAYISAVAKGLLVGPAAVAVTDVYLAGSRRRLLQATSEVMVETEVLVAPETVPGASGAALANTLSAAMQEEGIEIAGISNVGIESVYRTLAHTTTTTTATAELVTTTTTPTDPGVDYEPPVLSAPVRLEFVARVSGSMMEFIGNKEAYQVAVANSLVVEPAAVSISTFYSADLRRRLLAAEVMVETRVVVPPERVPDVSGPALVDTFRLQMANVGLEISAILNAGVTTIGVVATNSTNTSTTPAPTPDDEGGVSSMLLIMVAASAGGVVFLCLVCGCVIWRCSSAGNDATWVPNATPVQGGRDGRGWPQPMPKISAYDMCVYP